MERLQLHLNVMQQKTKVVETIHVHFSSSRECFANMLLGKFLTQGHPWNHSLWYIFASIVGQPTISIMHVVMIVGASPKKIT